MVLKDDYGKQLIEINEEEFIYRRRLRKIFIKRSDIRSILYDNDFFGILTYKGKIYSLGIGSLLFSQRNKLEELRNLLNKENILFNYTKDNNKDRFSITSLIYFIMIFLGGDKDKLVIAFMIILIVILIYQKIYETKVFFNLDKDEFEINRLKRTIRYGKDEVGKINLRKYYNEIYSIEFKKNKKKYEILFKGGPYLIKIYNLSLPTIFNQNIEH